jgi:hypothetical protein
MSKLSYTYDEAAAESGLTADVLRAAVKSGDLIVSYASTRNPVFRHADLEQYLLGLPNVPPPK